MSSVYLSIPHDAGLEALKKGHDNQKNKKTSPSDLTKMTEFVFKDSYF